MLNGIVNEIDQKPKPGGEVRDIWFSEIDRGKENFQNGEGKIPGVNKMQCRSQSSQSGTEVSDVVKIFFGWPVSLASIPRADLTASGEAIQIENSLEPGLVRADRGG